MTHGEPHAGNVMRTDEGRLLVDWDTVALAPPERDLWMLVVGGRRRSRALCPCDGDAAQRSCARLLPPHVGSQGPRRVPQGASLAAPGKRRHREAVSGSDESAPPSETSGRRCLSNPMRLVIACAAALVLSGSAAAALPRHGTLVPGRSLGGIRLGEPAAQVRAALGSKFGVCRGCATTTWYFTYRTFDRGASPSSSPRPRLCGLHRSGGRPAGLRRTASSSAPSRRR